MGKTMRLDKYLKDMRVATRSQAHNLIQGGHVTVNGECIKIARHPVDPGLDEVSVGGQLVGWQQHWYFLMNKPVAVVTATTDKDTPTVFSLFNQADYRDDLFPVGRLDKDTTGALLITNDGDLGHRLTSPKHHVTKLYQAQVTGHLQTADVETVAAGITLKDGTVVRPAELTLGDYDVALDQTTITLAITEGKYHQVKRMIASLGQRVVQLERVSFGPLILGTLLPGHYRALSETEITQLQKTAGIEK
ncbi:hypothetical protein IV55_GL000984 [Furfurilactobacillus siliginis]|uniref:Pseudouridine synthase n=2 Tax=Furfurilactobacillus siliginis TaxID=348151 RepID=A0A0R2L2E9_9LACO|nr:pseudouridine synthase [Furfurilactobacillus siliginis]KRN93676.1 hypothetical protein IV55_GL000984 [Furfurilactobacillus siliginis]GEK28381.1 pseudouridine synthase [Furfurilactobacillus siliginis]